MFPRAGPAGSPLCCRLGAPALKMKHVVLGLLFLARNAKQITKLYCNSIAVCKDAQYYSKGFLVSLAAGLLEVTASANNGILN